jgi:thioredoxin reductase
VDVVDVVVVGGGPAGLSAALMLGRCCREVIVFDAGRPRNAVARGVHGFLSREGTPPAELLAIAREQLGRYDTVELRRAAVRDARRTPHGFVVTPAEGPEVACRKLVLATGVVDELPDIPGVADLWGRSVFPCPYCDAYELRGRPLGVLGGGEPAATLARVLTTWSDEVTVFTGVPEQIDDQLLARLRERGVRFAGERVLGLEAHDGSLVRVRLEGRGPVACQALFVSGGQHQRSPLIARLGCDIGERGTVETGKCESTNVPGLFVVGDASHDAQLVVVAAAEGAQAACEINRSLSREEFAEPRSS